MLVIRRKAGESVILNDVIAIRILVVEGDRAKIGIEAPPDVIIVRDELLEAGHPFYRPRTNSFGEVWHAPSQSRLD